MPYLSALLANEILNYSRRNYTKYHLSLLVHLINEQYYLNTNEQLIFEYSFNYKKYDFHFKDSDFSWFFYSPYNREYLRIDNSEIPLFLRDRLLYEENNKEKLELIQKLIQKFSSMTEYELHEYAGRINGLLWYYRPFVIKTSNTIKDINQYYILHSDLMKDWNKTPTKQEKDVYNNFRKEMSNKEKQMELDKKKSMIYKVKIFLQRIKFSTLFYSK